MSRYINGEIIKGTVSGIENYGIFIKIDESYNGLIHISEISDGFVRNVEDYVKIGDTIYAEVLEIDDNSHQAKLSIKNISYRVGTRIEKKKIVETKLGFKTLEKNLPIWIEENIKKSKKEINSIDK